jgi:hypothetical protein
MSRETRPPSTDNPDNTVETASRIAVGRTDVPAIDELQPLAFQ